jgi:CelD/BcsL family acetyltransferase involved in cellulose biosynthesis
LHALSSSSRSLVTRSLREFDRWAGGEVEHVVANTPQELDEGRRIIKELHAARWSEAGQAGAFASPRFSAFHDRVMPHLLEGGNLELSWIRARGEPVAALYNFVWNDRVLFYQSGRKVDLPNKIRLGIVAHAHAIRRAIEAKRHEYDFLSGSQAYKAQLALAARPMIELTALRPSARALMRTTIDHAIDRWRDLRALFH